MIETVEIPAISRKLILERIFIMVFILTHENLQNKQTNVSRDNWKHNFIFFSTKAPYLMYMFSDDTKMFLGVHSFHNFCSKFHRGFWKEIFEFFNYPFILPFIQQNWGNFKYCFREKKQMTLGKY